MDKKKEKHRKKLEAGLKEAQKDTGRPVYFIELMKYLVDNPAAGIILLASEDRGGQQKILQLLNGEENELVDLLAELISNLDIQDLLMQALLKSHIQ